MLTNAGRVWTNAVKVFLWEPKPNVGVVRPNAYCVNTRYTPILSVKISAVLNGVLVCSVWHANYKGLYVDEY